MVQTSNPDINDEKAGVWIIPKKYYWPLTKVMPPDDRGHAWTFRLVHLG